MLNIFNTFSDFMNRVLVAQRMILPFIFFNYSTFIFNILKILKKEGYIDSIFLLSNNNLNFIIVKLKYCFNKPVITIFKKFSKYNIKIYKGYRYLPKVVNGLGITIVSTNKGLLTDRECKKLGIGGELICYVF